MSTSLLRIELLNGPLDGHIIMVSHGTSWSREGSGVASFPWDNQLGAPQGHFVCVQGGWLFQHAGGRDSKLARIMNRTSTDSFHLRLECGDILFAGTTWMMVCGSE
jgi:hypothetical protein